MRPWDGERDTAQHRLSSHRRMRQPYRFFHPPILHTSDDGAVPHLLDPLDTQRHPFAVHEMNQARRRGAPAAQALSQTT